MQRKTWYIPVLRKEFHYATLKYQLEQKRMQSKHHTNVFSMVLKESHFKQQHWLKFKQILNNTSNLKVTAEIVPSRVYLTGNENKSIRKPTFHITNFILKNVNVTNHAYMLRRCFTAVNFLPFSFYCCCIDNITIYNLCSTKYVKSYSRASIDEIYNCTTVILQCSDLQS